MRYVPHVFFFTGSKGSYSFTNVVPGARCAWNFVDDIALIVFGRSKLRDREMLLKSFYRSAGDLDVLFLEDSCKRFRDAFDVGKDCKVT